MPSDGTNTSANSVQFSSLPMSLGKVGSEGLYLAMDPADTAGFSKEAPANFSRL